MAQGSKEIPYMGKGSYRGLHPERNKIVPKKLGMMEHLSITPFMPLSVKYNLSSLFLNITWNANPEMLALHSTIFPGWCFFPSYHLSVSKCVDTVMKNSLFIIPMIDIFKLHLETFNLLPCKETHFAAI